jgi:hypothetical protein
MKLFFTLILLNFGNYLSAQTANTYQEKNNSAKDTNNIINDESDTRSKAGYLKFNSSSKKPYEKYKNFKDQNDDTIQSSETNNQAISGYSNAIYVSIKSNIKKVNAIGGFGVYNIKKQVIKPSANISSAAENDTIIKPKSLQKRVALIIGNGLYTNAAPLHNPENDAEAMSKALTQLGFKVYKKRNVDYPKMQTSLKEFGNEVNNADIAIIFYSGHGIQIDGANYLLPTDVKLDKKENVFFEAINVENVMAVLESNQKTDRLNIVILDACRNNPFCSWSRGGEVGLVGITPPSGSLIAYSTSPNSVASDGSGKNGLYTGELIKQLLKPQRIEDVFINTRIVVEKKSGGKQSPWELARLRGKYNLFE